MGAKYELRHLFNPTFTTIVYEGGKELRRKAGPNLLPFSEKNVGPFRNLVPNFIKIARALQEIIQKSILVSFSGHSVVLTLFVEGCPTIWQVYENSKVYGGWPVSNASSSAECRQACDQNSTCGAYDFDSTKQPGYQCYLHSVDSQESIYVGIAPGVKHFSRHRNNCGLSFQNYLCHTPKICNFINSLIFADLLPLRAFVIYLTLTTLYRLKIPLRLIKMKR